MSVVATGVLFDCVCATEPRVLASVPPDVDDFLDALLEDRDETNNAPIERLGELAVLLLRIFHVHNVDRVVVRLNVLVSLAFVWRSCPRG